MSGRAGHALSFGLALVAATACGHSDPALDAGLLATPDAGAGDVGVRADGAAEPDGLATGADGSAAADGAGRPDGAASSDAALAGDGATADAGVPLRVLFIGNSYTFVNDLPTTVAVIGAATPGGAVEVDSITAGGARLSDHWGSEATRERIATGGFGAVVLQGQSLEPLGGGQDFAAHASLFSAAVRDAGAAGVWYATWARREGDPLYAELGLGDPASMTRDLEMAYQLAADLDGDVVARAGAAWQLALAELPDIELYAPDGSHPSPAATVLTACVMLQALTGQTPRVPEPPPLGVPADDATALCDLAPRVR